jgi:hypothetical protein
VNSTMMGIDSSEAIVRFWGVGLEMRGRDDGSNCLSDGEGGEFDISGKSCVWPASLSSCSLLRFGSLLQRYIYFAEEGIGGILGIFLMS